MNDDTKLIFEIEPVITDNIEVTEVDDTLEMDLTDSPAFLSTDYKLLTNKPILNTNNTESLDVLEEETIQDTIFLHKISKTGQLLDLNGLEDIYFKDDIDEQRDAIFGVIDSLAEETDKSIQDLQQKDVDIENSIKELDERKIDTISIDGEVQPMKDNNVDLHIPLKISELQNDLNFIDNTVSSLKNYYLKQETYTKGEVNTIVSNIHTFSVQIVDELPTEDIDTKTIYLVLKEDSEQDDYYDEYMYINSQWEMIGNTKIDLSNYYTKQEIDNKLYIVDEEIDSTNERVRATENSIYMLEDMSTKNKNDIIKLEEKVDANKVELDKTISDLNTKFDTNTAAIDTALDELNALSTEFNTNKEQVAGQIGNLQTQIDNIPQYSAGEGLKLDNYQFSIKSSSKEEIGGAKIYVEDEYLCIFTNNYAEEGE